MKKLPKKFKEKWVKALVSGEYEQGDIGALLYQGKHCCLGVACELAGYEPDFRGYIDRDIWPGVPRLISGDGPIPYGLAILNDSGVPFEVIAGVINEWL